jgi:hypothetical protein
MTQPEFDIEFPDSGASPRGEGVAARKEARSRPSVTVKWTRVTAVKRPKCDICIARMELGGSWHAPDPVAWERTGDGTLMYACYFDAAPLRDAEGFKDK